MNLTSCDVHIQKQNIHIQHTTGCLLPCETCSLISRHICFCQHTKQKLIGVAYVCLYSRRTMGFAYRNSKNWWEKVKGDAVNRLFMLVGETSWFRLPTHTERQLPSALQLQSISSPQISTEDGLQWKFVTNHLINTQKFSPSATASSLPSIMDDLVWLCCLCLCGDFYFNCYYHNAIREQKQNPGRKTRAGTKFSGRGFNRTMFIIFPFCCLPLNSFTPCQKRNWGKKCMLRFKGFIFFIL